MAPTTKLLDKSSHRSLTTYAGGKNGAGTYQNIINNIPAHIHTYIEACVGSGAIFRRLKPADTIILNDIDPSVMQVWKSTQGLKNVILENMPVVDLLIKYKSELKRGVFVYIDPPYLFTTRKCHRRMYKYEMEYIEHVELLAQIRDLNCDIMISSYDNSLYNDLLKGWRKYNYKSATRQGAAIETLYMNYSPPTALHDDRYLGTDYREREKIKQMRNRWLNRFEKLEPTVRTSVLTRLLQQYK